MAVGDFSLRRCHVGCFPWVNLALHLERSSKYEADCLSLIALVCVMPVWAGERADRSGTPDPAGLGD